MFGPIPTSSFPPDQAYVVDVRSTAVNPEMRSAAADSRKQVTYFLDIVALLLCCRACFFYD